MSRLLKYGWILGLLCLPLGGLQIYWYLSNTGSLGVIHLPVGLFILAAGVLNLGVYFTRRNKRTRKGGN